MVAINGIVNIIVNYWPLLIVLLSVFCCAIYIVNNFLGKTREERLENIKQWAIYACALAEKELGSGTGQLKMRATYNMFLSTFPKLANVISFETYQHIAEMALTEFKHMLETNPKVKDQIIQEGEVKYGNIENE